MAEPQTSQKNEALTKALSEMGQRLDSSYNLLNIISELTAVPLKARDLKDAAKNCLEVLQKRLGNIERCSIMLYNNKERCLKLLSAMGASDLWEEEPELYNHNLSFKPGEGIAGRVFSENRPYFYDVTQKQSGLLKEDGCLNLPQSLACLPLSLPNGSIGVLNISFFNPKPFDQSRRHELRLLSGVSANIIQSFFLKSEIQAQASALQSKVIQCELEIQERIQAQEELKKTQKKLAQAQKMEALGTLSSGIAHDFNNILQGISGQAQLLRSLNPGPKEGGCLDQIENSIARAAELIKKMLSMGTKTEFNLVPLDFKAEIRRVVDLMDRSKLAETCITCDTPDNLWTVSGDSVQLERAMVNIGLNALEALNGSGKLEFRAENYELKEEDSPQLPNLPPGHYVRLLISDDGPGIPPEVIDHIFEPFFTTKEIGKGAGLGLSTSYGVVKGHGGHIRCVSTPGQGSVFELYLPALPKARPIAEKAPAREIPVDVNGETLLLVDDDPAVIDVAEEILAMKGYQVLRANSGEKALEVYRQKRNEVDLIILDLGMPGMGGHKCLQELLKLDRNAKVVIASGYAVDGPVKKALEDGAVDFLSKPYQFEDLTQIVQKTLAPPERAAQKHI